MTDPTPEHQTEPGQGPDDAGPTSDPAVDEQISDLRAALAGIDPSELEDPAEGSEGGDGESGDDEIELVGEPDESDRATGTGIGSVAFASRKDNSKARAAKTSTKGRAAMAGNVFEQKLSATPSVDGTDPREVADSFTEAWERHKDKRSRQTLAEVLFEETPDSDKVLEELRYRIHREVLEFRPSGDSSSNGSKSDASSGDKSKSSSREGAFADGKPGGAEIRKLDSGGYQVWTEDGQATSVGADLYDRKKSDLLRLARENKIDEIEKLASGSPSASGSSGGGAMRWLKNLGQV